MCDISEEVDLCGNCMEKGTFTNGKNYILLGIFDYV
jgi:hypothetical protein